MEGMKKDEGVVSGKKKKTTKEKNESTETPTKTRKPRASKIVTKSQIVANAVTPTVTNVILNLKCSMSDLREYNNKLSQLIRNPLEYNSSAPPEVRYYDGEKMFGTFIQNDANKSVEPVEDETTKSSQPFTVFNTEHEMKENYSNIVINENDMTQTPIIDDVNIKDMSAKLKQLKIQLYKNALNTEKKSACFWCTYDFDTPACYIPKYEMDNVIYGYGSFCRPECAVAYLMKETIDDSTKFERYHLLNQIYSKVYDCKKNIKPAPDPHYLLDKFYGNLTIQEYRRLLKTEHLLLVIDKPLTRILPELHEDTDDAFTKIYGIKATTSNSSGVYKVKRQSEQPQGPSKASIIKNTFGIST